MEITFTHSQTIIKGAYLDLDKTFNCGQAFRWNRTDTGFFGVAGDKPLVASQDGDTVILDTDKAGFEGFWADYFDFSLDYDEINRGYTDDPILAEGMRYAHGIRVLNQQPFETLISFIISANNNVGRIRGIIARLCAMCGRQIGEGAYAFPRPADVARLSEDDLKAIGSGYRAPYILKTARMVEEGELEGLRRLNYDTAVKALMAYSGVGRKVADCVALFSLGFKNAFPLDVWMKRVMFEVYGVDEKSDVYAFISERFGPYAGIAQQYLFYYARENKLGVKKKD